MSDLNESHLAMARIVDALFCSGLETGTAPTGRQVAHAIRGALRKYRNWDGLTRAVAEAFGRAPAVAERREEWCREIAERALTASVIQVALSRME